MHRYAMDRANPPTRILMACLGDASRFRLVKVLIAGERCVTELAAEVGLSQSCTTRHLQALEKRRVVEGTRVGKKVMYRLRHEEPGLDPLLAWALMPGRRVNRAGSESPSRGDRPGDRGGKRGPSAPRGLFPPGGPEGAERAPWGRGGPGGHDGRPSPTGPGAAMSPEASPTATEPISPPFDGPSADTPEVGPDPGQGTRGVAPTPARPRRADLEDYLL